MGKHKNATKVGGVVQRDISPTPSFQGGEPEDSTHVLLEEVSTQMNMSPKVPLRFTQLSRSPSICSLSPKGGQTHLVTPDDQMHYCIDVRVILGEGEVTNCHLPMHGVDH